MLVLLTGGSGFIAAHVLEILLTKKHSVMTTVRSQEKADKIRSNYPNADLDFAIVPDMAQPGAFDDAVKLKKFDAVIHTASPFHFDGKDIQKDLLDPALNGTRGILTAVKNGAPTVQRVVITSSFAAIIDGSKGFWPEHTYTAADWSPLTHEEALQNQSNGYRYSKTSAEKFAWEFVEKEKPNFKIATLCPPLVLGPIIHYLNSLDTLNTSNQRVRDLLQGKCKDEIPETGVFLWVDVRDLALAHVVAMEKPEAANKRFFITAGNFSNKEIAEIIRKDFPKYESALPSPSTPGGDYPAGGIFKADIGDTASILGVKFTSLEDSIVDLVKSLEAVGV